MIASILRYAGDSIDGARSRSADHGYQLSIGLLIGLSILASVLALVDIRRMLILDQRPPAMAEPDPA